MSVIASREEARALVEEAAASHGHLKEYYWQRLGECGPDVKRAFETAFLKKDTLIGSAVITLAKNLYSNPARFVFELLQNCEDNEFTKARERGEEPFVLFEVYPDHITVECNEDGFTRKHLSAICNIGRSSKHGPQAYIGEKGIGFKSVFKVAYKAEIQSGHFCFSFTHKKGDLGMGMISPDWMEDKAPAPHGRTRITLRLHQDDADSVAASGSISTQFETIQAEMLLFMRKIQRITVKTYNSDHQLQDSSTYSRRNGTGRIVTTEKLYQGGDSEKRITNHFYLSRSTATGLPKSEMREYSDDALASESYKRGEIVLAFPLDDSSAPIVQEQWLFSFLPVSRTRFRFIIQADFVTSASRESIETTSPRNRALGKNIPKAFIRAILQMCEHDTLQYRWMRYLPSTDDEHAWGSFWALVVDSIKTHLAKTPVLRPASLGPLRRISELRKQFPCEFDRDGMPLFPDITPELYMSQNYTNLDIAILEKNGLPSMFMAEIIRRVEHDLQDGSSRIKSYEDTDWHTRAAQLLQIPFEKKWDDRIQEVRDMELLHLTDGNWTTINDGAVYYTDMDKLTIPDGLQLRVVNPLASGNRERRKLFDLIGVRKASIKLVRDQIRQRYRQTGSWSLTNSISVADMHFMYLTQDAATLAEEKLGVKIATSEMSLKDSTSIDVYFPSEDPLSASKLLAPTPSGPGTDDGAPGFSVSFLNNCYLDRPPPEPPAALPGWMTWLHRSLHIRHHLRLQARSSDDISEACRYVARHRPKKFMNLLNRLWQLESPQLRQRENLVKQLQEVKVLCRGDHFYKLRDTFLPTKHLGELANRFLALGDPFRWIQVESLPDRKFQLRDWEDLASGLQFGLPSSDLEFGLTILSYLQDVNTGKSHDLSPSVEGSSGHRRIHDLYVFLEAQIRGSNDEISARRNVQERVANRPVIFIPAGVQSKEALWVHPRQCFWTTPIRSLRTMYTLESLYTGRPGESTSSSGGYSLKTFFSNVVDVCEWNSRYAIDEIKAQKEGDADFDCIIDLYRWLSNSKPSKKVAEDIRHAFESDALIYKPGNMGRAWHRSSDCLWTSATTIPGKTPINNDGDYDGLESLFLDVIGVPKMTLKMLYGKLSDPELNVPLDELKGDLLEFSALLAGAESGSVPESIHAAPMRKNYIFPVRQPDGEVVLVSGNDHFAIIDRAPLAAGFRDKAQLLDFDIEQTRGLENFIRWIGLQERYLSNSVREIFVPDRSSSRTISEPQRQIGKKAGALLRIAVDCGSPRTASGYDELFEMLRNCDTLETKHISTTLLLHQGGKEPITHKTDDGIALYIDGNTEGMKVFVPRKTADREACFQSKLPKYLLEWIMSHPDTNITETWDGDMTELFRERRIRAVQAVLSAPSSSLKGILEEYGIPDIDGDYVDEVDNDDEDGEESEVENGVGDEVGDEGSSQLEELNVAGHDIEDGDQEQIMAVSPSEPHRRQASQSLPQVEVENAQNVEDVLSHRSSVLSETGDERPVLTPSPSTRSATPSAGLQRSESTSTSVIARTENLRSVSASIQPIDHNPPRPIREPSPVREPSPAVVPQQPTPYQLLLQQVVQRARGMVFPSRGVFDMSAMRRDLPEPTRDDPAVGLPFLRSFGRRERDNMVGAAGELFVYELLRHLQPSLPGFDINNWKSNIRGYVNEHPEYSEISSWGGAETADITYRDETGSLTSFLADKGYLERFDVDSLQQAKPLYYLEVKSTPYLYETTTFFMNRAQYRRMQNCSQNVPGQENNVESIYIVVRVFNLGKDSVSVKLLVDPEGMRHRGELSFEADSWRVRPNAA